MIEIVLRLVTAGLFLAVSISVLPKARCSTPRMLGFFLALSLSALCVTSALDEQINSKLHLFLGIIDAPNIVLVWLFGLSLYDDQTGVRRTHIAIAVTYTGLMVLVKLGDLGYVPVTSYPAWISVIAAYGVIGHLAFRVLKGWRDDLIERRRRSRPFIIAFIAIAAFAGMTITNNVWNLEQFGSGLSDAYVLAAAALLTCRYFLTVPDQTLFIGTQSVQKPALESKDPVVVRILEKLNAKFEEEKAYKNEALTFPRLCREIGESEHRVRNAISEYLGFRNYSDYVNSYRVAEACKLLTSEEHMGLPVTEVALSSGFGSLSAFNRIFRNRVGMSPSQFRLEDSSDPRRS